ncbi:hypothetical protein GQ44DRAFT_716026 [Phaeosphaeriaceae sp. PMI808]|nr:hypothetical protein GQ44DRAFT_716026 [Phaeosphaeriaceae sp. PMI808]
MRFRRAVKPLRSCINATTTTTCLRNFRGSIEGDLVSAGIGASSNTTSVPSQPTNTNNPQSATYHYRQPPTTNPLLSQPTNTNSPLPPTCSVSHPLLSLKTNSQWLMPSQSLPSSPLLPFSSLLPRHWYPSAPPLKPAVSH